MNNMNEKKNQKMKKNGQQKQKQEKKNIRKFTLNISPTYKYMQICAKYKKHKQNLVQLIQMR